ncbi:hypothetical protein MHYP_G00133990 [Metynnis hypsauchen]
MQTRETTLPPLSSAGLNPSACTTDTVRRKLHVTVEKKQSLPGTPAEATRESNQRGSKRRTHRTGLDCWQGPRPFWLVQQRAPLAPFRPSLHASGRQHERLSESKDFVRILDSVFCGNFPEFNADHHVHVVPYSAPFYFIRMCSVLSTASSSLVLARYARGSQVVSCIRCMHSTLCVLLHNYAPASPAPSASQSQTQSFVRFILGQAERSKQNQTSISARCSEKVLEAWLDAPLDVPLCAGLLCWSSRGG